MLETINKIIDNIDIVRKEKGLNEYHYLGTEQKEDKKNNPNLLYDKKKIKSDLERNKVLELVKQ